MDSEFSLYQKVWGEPESGGRVPEAAGPSLEPDPLDETAGYSSESSTSPSWVDEENTSAADKLILRRLEQIEERMSQIRLSEAESRQLLENGFAELTDALRDLDSRLIRLEKGVVRSLEYLKSRIEDLGR